tara:strand:+ start:4199 stop:5563 length:1365 start_codon:yes stop_codon:yes gene_type:complete
MLIESISGVRGISEQDLNDRILISYAKGINEFCKNGKILIARDSRKSGEKILSIIFQIIKQSGRKIKNCGIVPTPTLQYAVKSTNAVAGIMITASHNPSEWNGIKFICEDGCFFNEKQINRLLKLKNEFLNSNNSSFSDVLLDDNSNNEIKLINSHIKKVLGIPFIDFSKIKKRKLKIAVDAVNGAGSIVLPNLLKEVGCNVVEINCKPTGEFTRGTEPIPENLDFLSTTVLKEKCDIGFATDPDGDRLAVIDNDGNPIGEEYTLVLALKYFLESTNYKKTVITNLSTTLAVDKIANQNSVEVIRTKVGEINVVEMMKKQQSSFGGEGNGGVIFGDIHLGRDSLVASILIIALLCNSEKSLSDLMKTLPKFYICKDKVSIEGINQNKLFKKLNDIYKKNKRNNLDGLKILFDDQWIHIRKSNTEPIVRIYAESTSLKKANHLINDIKDIIIKIN